MSSIDPSDLEGYDDREDRRREKRRKKEEREREQG